MLTFDGLSHNLRLSDHSSSDNEFIDRCDHNIDEVSSDDIGYLVA